MDALERALRRRLQSSPQTPLQTPASSASQAPRQRKLRAIYLRLHLLYRQFVSTSLMIASLAVCALGALLPPPVEPPSALVETLLERTAENRDANERAVRRITQQNAYLAVSGQDGMKRLLTGLDGENVFLDEPAIARMTRARL